MTRAVFKAGIGVGIVVCLLTAAAITWWPRGRAQTGPRKVKVNTDGPKVKLDLVLPKPQFVGTPKNLKSANLEAPRKAQCRPAFYVPPGLTNVARGKKVTGSDMDPVVGRLEMLTDGDKEGEEGSYVELGPGVQYVQIDLGATHGLYAVVVWHFHNQARVYRDVIVQCSDDPAFEKGVRTIFNNDHDNSSGLGLGKDKEYIETYEGRLIDPKGAKGRYLRLYSNGSTAGDMNHYIEIEAYARPAGQARAAAEGKGGMIVAGGPRSGHKACEAIAAGVWAALPATAPAPRGRLAFIPSGKTEEYRFDTGLLRGTLRRGGKSRGLSSVTHVPSGTRLDGALGILSHYRVFTTNKRYGHAAWDWPSTSKLLGDGAVQVRWPAGKDHPFELTAVYRWSAANALDVTTTVKAHKDLPKFESFLASYFHKDFAASLVYARSRFKSNPRPNFQTTEKSLGIWQMFPRGPKVVPIIQDGRWRLHPNPVKWTIRGDLAAPIGLRHGKKSGLTAILMAPGEDCFALSTPYTGEGHFSLYLSLFGRDVKAGRTATARSRMVIANSPTDGQILRLYKEYMNELTGALQGRRR